MMNFGGGDDWDDSELIKAYDKAVKNWRKSKSTDDGNLETKEVPAIGAWESVKKEEKIPTNCLTVGMWVLGSPCRAIWTDGLEYEAKIVTIEGIKCTIRFVGYGNQESKELNDLKETFGKKSRDRQRREAQQGNSEFLSTGGPIDRYGEDYFSSVSLTSSMCNNCEREEDQLELTATDASASDYTGLRESVSSSSVVPTPKRKTSPAGKRKRNEEVDTMSVDPEDNSVLDAADVVPSAAEATMGSSSSTSDISEDDNDDGDDEATSAPGPFRETLKSNFPSMIPQFPVPPMPMSLADANGKFDFRRGQLPSLLLSWYMSGYHAGYFDASQEKKSRPKEESTKGRNKRQ